MTKNLTQGKVFGQILGFTVPLLIGNLLQQIYNMADGIIVGRFVGKEAFAAVGAVGSINFMILGFILGVCNGLCVPVSQFFGAGDMKQMRKRVAAAIYIAAVTAVLFTTVTVFSCDTILRWMNTPADILYHARGYLIIIFIGIPGIILYNLPANILRALGDSKTPLYFLVLASILNIGLDLVFVIVFHWGAAGTAVATVTAQVVSGLLCIVYIRKKYEVLKFTREDWQIDWHAAKVSLGIGVPMGLQFSITAIGSVVIQTAVNGFGSDAVAAVNAAIKIQMVFCQGLESMGMTMATFTSQNIGAGNVKRVKEGVSTAVKIACVYCIVVFLIMNPLVESMSGIFITASDMTPFIGNTMKTLLFINSIFYIPLAFIYIFRSTLQGLGCSVLAMGAGLCEMVGRCLAAFAAVSFFGFQAVFAADPAAWITANALLLPMYYKVIKKLEVKYADSQKYLEQEEMWEETDSIGRKGWHIGWQKKSCRK